MTDSPLDDADDGVTLLPSGGAPVRAARRLRFAFLAVAGLAALVLWWSGIAADVAHPDRVREIVRSAGPWAPLAFVVLLIPLNLLFLAGAPVWISASLWPLPLAIAYSVAGTVIASTSTYLLARRFGHHWGGAGVPRRLRRIERRIDGKPVRTVATLRLLLWINPGVDLLMAAARVPLRHYVAGTFVGMLVPTALRVCIGDMGIEALSEIASGDDPAAWPWLLAATVAVGAIALARRRRKRLAGEVAALGEDADLALKAE